jgi:hypothetical protein
LNLTAQEIIEKFEVMDKSISKALETGNADDLYDFNFESGMLEQRIPSFKGHLHCPKHLQYLIDQFKWTTKRKFNYYNDGGLRNVEVAGWVRINDNL